MNYFESTLSSIVPFANIISVTYGQGLRVDIDTTGVSVPSFTFASKEDKETQLNNYKQWLLKQDQIPSLQ